MSLFVRTGFYKGNGTSRVIDGLGFAPKFIRVYAKFPGDAAGVLGERWKFDTLSGATSWTNDAANDIASSITIDADGFTLGTDTGVNTVGTWYSWQAFGGTDVVTDTYTGDGNPTQAITGVGSKPKFVQICRTDSRRTFRFDSQTGDSSFDSQYNASLADRIESIDSDGFTVGDSDYVNASSATYHYVCFVGSNAVVGTYTGTGLSRSIDTGINVDALYIKKDTAAYETISPGWEISFDQPISAYLENTFIDTVDPIAWQLNAWRVGNQYLRIRKGTSFQLEGANSESNENTSTYFYLVVANTTRETDEVRVTALDTQVLWIPDTPDNRLTALDVQVLYAPVFGPGAVGDDLDNWNDSISLAIEYIPQAFGDSLNNWNDSVVHDYIYIYKSFGDDLNNWSDNKAYDLVAAGPGKTVQKGSDLDSWLDAVNLQLNYFLQLSDDLDNWLDGVNLGFADKTEVVGDSLNNWLDAAVVELPELSEQVGDDLNTWLDSAVVEFPEKSEVVGDDLNNWLDKAKHDHPDILLSFGDSLHNWQDSIGQFGQPYPQDTLNYWQDNVSLLMPSNLRYQVFVDWENDGAFGSEIDNITQDVYEMQWSYGRDYASQLTGNSTAGQCKILLRNTTGKYNSFKTTSPLYGNLIPGRKIIILMHTSDTSTQMFGGYIDTIEAQPSIHGAHTAVLSGLGPISAINEQKVNVGMYTNIKTGTAIGHVLNAAGWPGSDRLMDVGYTTMSRWWTGGKLLALTAIRRIEDTEAGFFRETKDGKLAFEDKWHRLKIANFVSKATFRDVHGASVVYSDIYQEDPLKEIYNIAETKVRYFYEGDPNVVLWNLNEVPAIAPGETVEYWAACPSAGSSSGAVAAEEWITPSPIYDYSATAEAGGGGFNMTYFLTFVVTKFDTGMKMLITNFHGSNTAYLHQLQARGTGIYETLATNIQDEYTDSQALYGERTWPATDTFFPDIATAEGYIHWILENYSFPRPIINLEFSTYRNADLAEAARTLDISDMIDIEANPTTKLGINRKFFIEKITHRVTDGGLEHRVQFECSAVVGGAFMEQAVGDDLNNWDDGINYQLDDVIYTPVDKTVVIHEMWLQGMTNRTVADGGAWQTNVATYTLDPSKFNGVVKCEWEIVALNATGAGSKDIDLYENMVKIKTITVPDGVNDYRSSVEITWPSSTKNYVIEIPPSAYFDDTYIYISRFKIYQENATKTQIQINFHGETDAGGWNWWGPDCLFQGGENHPAAMWSASGSIGAGDTWVTETTVLPASEQSRTRHTRWTYHEEHWASIANIKFEACMETWYGTSFPFTEEDPCTGHLRVYDETASTQIGAAISLTNPGTSKCTIRAIKTTNINPASLVDGHTYVIQGKVTREDPADDWGHVFSLRTCIYLELNEGLEAFESYYHLAMSDISYEEVNKHYLDFDDFDPITSVRYWAEAARASSSGYSHFWITDDTETDEYGHIHFPWLGSQTHELREQEFDYQQLSAGNYHGETYLAGWQRAQRMIVYQNINEKVLIDDLNNWDDDANVVRSP